MKLKIKKGDVVQVIAGSAKGRKGEVLQLNRGKLKVRVAGVREQTHFDKKEGIRKSEGFIDFSNIKLVESKAREAKKTAKSKASARK
jgi:large subunit ribosomal protein L24